MNINVVGVRYMIIVLLLIFVHVILMCNVKQQYLRTVFEELSVELISLLRKFLLIECMLFMEHLKINEKILCSNVNI